MTDAPIQQNLSGGQITTLGRLTVRARRDGDVLTISLSGELDLSNAGDVESELLDAEATDARTIALELAELEFMDSTGIKLLVEASARSRRGGAAFVVRRPSPAVARLLRISGVEGLLGLAD